jgi:hypothetical protein
VDFNVISATGKLVPDSNILRGLCISKDMHL